MIGNWHFCDSIGTLDPLVYEGTTLMYELEYVKKRKRRRLIAIIGGISMIGVSALSITSFLGRFVGTFTVSLDTGNVKLTLSRKKDLSLSTSYLRVDYLPDYHEFTYSAFSDYGDDVIDSETTDIDLGAITTEGGDIDGLNFFKYTFYVGNVGSVAANYNFRVNILENKLADDGRNLLDTLRVMLYENEEDDSHQSKVYARPYVDRASHIVDDVSYYEAPISISEDEARKTGVEFPGYAEKFENESVITTLSVENFEIGDIKRYTLVTWLEGFASASDKAAPIGASIKIGVEINAYEIQ